MNNKSIKIKKPKVTKKSKIQKPDNGKEIKSIMFELCKNINKFN